MLLAPNDTILKQFKHKITKYNNYNGDSLSVRELKEYESVDNTSLLEETIVFIARSDLLDCKENVGKDKNAKDWITKIIAMIVAGIFCLMKHTKGTARKLALH